MFKYKKLANFFFHIVGNKNKIKPFLLSWIGKEWQCDHEEFPDQKWTIEWLNLLHDMKFKLIVVELDNINLREDLINYKSDDYNFLEELNSRVEEMEVSFYKEVP